MNKVLGSINAVIIFIEATLPVSDLGLSHPALAISELVVGAVGAGLAFYLGGTALRTARAAREMPVGNPALH